MNRILKITKENSQYQILYALKNNRKKRRETGEVFIEGIESIKQAVKAGLEICRVVYMDYKDLSDWSKDLLGKYENALNIQMAPGLYRRLCDKEYPSELVITVKFTLTRLAAFELPEKPFLLILDRPGDKGNLGTLVRTANALGVHGVIILGHGVDPLDPKVIRTSLGALFFTPVIEPPSFSELEAWLESLKRQKGLKVLGTDSSGECNLTDFSSPHPLALVMGNEARGISRRLKEFCDQIIKIPITGDVNSLNVSCAGSIILWHCRQLIIQTDRKKQIF